MQTIPAKSSQYRNMRHAITQAKGFGFGQVADHARWRIGFPLSWIAVSDTCTDWLVGGLLGIQVR